MSSAMATPSSTMRAASFMMSDCKRGTMKPGAGLHFTGFLPIPSDQRDQASTTAGAVPACGLTSTSGIRYAGLSQ